MDIAILIALILLNGVFAMSEIALVTARKSRLQRLAEDDDGSAAIAIRLGEEPTRFLSTVQIGITAIGILNGIVGEAALAGPLAELLQGLGIDQKSSAVGATTIVVVIITYFSIVVGELVPKRIAQFNAEGIARLMARPIALLAQLSRPFVYLLSISTDGLLKLLGKKELGSANLTEEDIHAMLMEGSQSGVIEKQEHEMVRNVFRLDDRQIASLMTPRSEIICLDIEQPLEESLEKLIASDHSRFPVCKGGVQEVLGVITTKRLLKQELKGEPPEKITEYLVPAVYVPESLTGMKLLEQFRESGVQMVFVIDEYGEILGLVTLQDLLEALAGEFKPRDPEDVWAVQREDGSWLLDGLIPIPELKDRLDLRSVPEEEKGRYHTLSGMMMWLIGKVPRTGDITEWQGWRLEVVDLDGNRIDKVMASRLPDPGSEGRPEPGLSSEN
ncbi:MULTISPECIES: hemolysin family protein [Prosthecochloris]|uniref:HlyC/CorC family transporter n=1 Tax=Prosthecochloris vibrioformis TaxID=1098 RepID=A0A5C4RYJ6_PROVB|nr:MULTISPECIES: hemolysin family protein [Prosthecochloris]ANT65260.1 Magnesium and cobalt efflux protein CorC [Prosthecochloris sp. CIB 2401]TNJ36038.1 HlyC/CorC family transporter [Prosthecochloris vibrioformis]